MITVGQQFSKDLLDWEILVARWKTASRAKLFRAFRRIGVAWKGEAQKRIPVDTGMARQHVVTNTFWEGDQDLITETGTNLVDEGGHSYPTDLEFGTDLIAGGAVKALGRSPLLTDLDAIHTWPAKEGDETNETSASIRKIDGGTARFNRKEQFVGSNPQEQMPWLRPAFNRIRDWSQREISSAFEDSKRGG